MTAGTAGKTDNLQSPVVHKIAMDQMRQQQERELFNPLSVAAGHQPILIDILKFGLEAHPFEEKIGQILDYLVALPHLEFSAKAALFFVELHSETLTLKRALGFPEQKDIACSETRFGLCHCGQTAQRGTIQFFETPPPQHDVYSALQPFQGNYCVPIVKNGLPLGVLTIYVNKNHRPSPEIENLLEAIANIFAVIVENQQMDQQRSQLVNDLQATIVNLREENIFSESIFQGLNHGLIVADPEGKIIKSNAVAQSLFEPITELLDGQYLGNILGEDVASQLLTSRPPKADQFGREVSFHIPGDKNKIIGYSNVASEDAKGRKTGIIISLSPVLR